MRARFEQETDSPFPLQIDGKPRINFYSAILSPLSPKRKMGNSGQSILWFPLSLKQAVVFFMLSVEVGSHLKSSPYCTLERAALICPTPHRPPLDSPSGESHPIAGIERPMRDANLPLLNRLPPPLLLLPPPPTLWSEFPIKFRIHIDDLIRKLS